MFLDIAREFRKLWNTRVTVIPIIIGSIGTVLKGWERELEELNIEGWVETIQITALLRSVKILRRVLETWGDLMSLWLQ